MYCISHNVCNIRATLSPITPVGLQNEPLSLSLSQMLKSGFGNCSDANFAAHLVNSLIQVSRLE
jgi:hypothetical protein